MNNNKTRWISPSRAGLMLTLLCIAGTTAHAQSNAVNLDGGLIESAADNGDTSYSLGWSFTVNGSLSVTALGFYDDNNEVNDLIPSGLGPADTTAMSVSHPVGIFDATTGALLVQATISPTDTDTQTLADGALFRYDTTLTDGSGNAITTFTLNPGTTYNIAGLTYGDYYEYLPDSFSTDPSVNYIQDQYADGGDVETLTNPALSYGDNYGGITGQGFFGPSFQFSPASTATPEPSSLAALVTGTLGLIGLGLRRRKLAAK